MGNGITHCFAQKGFKVNLVDLSSEILNIFKSKRDEFVFKMKITSKDEFDILLKRVENLENKISKLETKKKKKTRPAKRS